MSNTSTTMAMPKPHRDRGIEGRLATWYAATTAKSMHDFQELAQRVARELPEGGSVLEVAPGPGYFCIAMANRGRYRVTGVDLSHSMVKIAREKAEQAGVQVNFEQGNAANLPFPRESFDFLVCRAAFKNFAQPVRALQEMHRVLKPGGQAVIIDLRRDASNESIAKAVDEMHVGAVNGLVTKLTFRFMLLKRAYTRMQFEEMVAETRFSGVEIREELLGLEVRLTKGRSAPGVLAGLGIW